MRLLLVEPESEGHHLALYTRFIVREARVRNWAVSLLTTAVTRARPSFELVAQEVGGKLPVLLMNEPSPRSGARAIPLLHAQYSLWKCLRSAYLAHNRFSNFDLIYFINIDYFEKCLSILGSPMGLHPFAGMFMNPKFHRASMKLGPPSRSDWLYEALFRRMLGIHTMKSLIVIDDPFRKYCVDKGICGASRIFSVPDVGEVGTVRCRLTARNLLGIPHDSFVILLYGKLIRRKGLIQLVQALAEFNDRGPVGLIAGEADSEMQRILNSELCQKLVRARRLVLRNMFHDDLSESLAFSAADIAWLGYTGGAYGSSGVLYQAASAGLPVIAMADGLIGWTVTTNEIGITVDPRDISAVTQTIEYLSNNAGIRQRFAENAKRLATRHTGSAFGRAVCDIAETSVCT